ncbi:CHAT domain-containing protein [bacterium]|nr:CHAT domain-containing protein [bacterium]
MPDCSVPVVFSRSMKLIRIPIFLLLSALALTPVLPLHCLQAQVIETPCPPTRQYLFPDVADSLRWVELQQDFNRRDSLYAFDVRETDRDTLILISDSLLQLSEALFGRDPHPALLIALKYSADARSMTDAQWGSTHYRLADSLYHSVYPCESAFSVDLRNGQGMFAWLREDYSAAEAFFASNQETLEHLGVADSTKLADNRYWLGLVRHQMGNYHSAVATFERAKECYLALGDSATAADCQYYLAEGLFLTQKFEQSEAAYRTQLQMQEALHGRIANPTIDALLELGDFYQHCGRYSDAQSVLTDAMQRTRHPSSAVSPTTQWSLQLTLGNVLEAIGDGAGAEEALREAASLSVRVPQEFRANVMVTSYNNLTVFFLRRGRNRQAEQILHKSMQLLDSLDEGRVLRLLRAKMFGTLGNINQAMHRFDEAEGNYLEAIRLFEEVQGKDARDLIYPLSNLALFYREKGQPERGYPLQQRAISLHRAFWDREHPRLGVMLRNLASIELAMGEDDSALTHVRQAITILGHSYEDVQFDLINSLYVYATWLLRHPNHDEAVEVMTRLVDACGERLRASFAFESEEQQLLLHSDLVSRYLATVAQWAVLPAAPPEAAQILYDGILKLKGAVLTENLRLRASMHLHTAENALYDELTQARSQYASLISRTSNEAEEGLDELKRHLIQRIDSLDARLRSVNVRYDQHRSLETATWRNIQRVLRPNEAVVEYLAVPRNSLSDSLQYYAVILSKHGSAAAVDLGGEHAIRDVLTKPGLGGYPAMLTSPRDMNALYNTVWAPITPHIKEAKRVYVVPDGLLHRLPFAALLPDTLNGWQHCLDAKVDLHRLTGSKQLLDQRQSSLLDQPVARDILLLGNPDFSDPSLPSSSDRRGWKALPGTARELTRIAGICDSLGMQTTVLEHDNATEQKLAASCALHPRFIHLATHGFFLPSRDMAKEVDTPPDSIQRGRSFLAYEQHPLLRSGLILAHANPAWTGTTLPPDRDDGILTAMEVAQLPLSGTELVTLSACETGLGDIRIGEGVFGLQRSFFSAGASALLMSLWVVPDQLTVGFMADFYSTWLAGASLADALRGARARLRARYDDPRIWAAFTLISP